MKEVTTLKKISEILGLSISTVSRALKNHPAISLKTKERVQQLALKLEYVPDANAIQLRTNNSRIFGLLLPFVSYYFYDSFLAAVEEECTKTGYSLLILQSGDNPETELNHLKLCRQNRISGLFVCITPETKDIGAFIKLNDSGTPVIFFDKVPAFEACNKVCAADEQAAELSAKAILLKNKKKVLALFGNPLFSITKKRLPAFRKVFEKENTKSELLIAYALDAEEARIETRQHLLEQDKPDTIFCMSDEILSGTMKAIQQLGLKVPGEIAVIAISNGFVPKLYYPEITYAETSGYKLGKAAFSRMISCLGGSTFIQTLSVESILVEGGSL